MLIFISVRGVDHLITIKAVILGIIQGLTEFLPVSSSGHLVLFQDLLGLDLPGLSFAIFLHLGTLISVLIVYWRTVTAMACSFGAWISGQVLWRNSPDLRLLGMIFIATIPAGVIGVALKPLFETAFESTLTVGFMLLLTGAILWVAEAVPVGRKSTSRVGGLDAIVIGTFQALAILPGISRSGMTISAGIFRNLDRETAGKFSFLMSIPAIVGAAALDLVDLVQGGVLSTGLPVVAVVAGTLAALVSGLFAIKILLRILRGGQLRGFSYYVWALGILIIGWRLLPL